jgi:DNA-directed RNA polymerase specialized sigma24 family protein
MDGSEYSVGEVVWLLQMSHQEAIDYDADPRDSCADLSEDPQGGGSADADPSLFVVLRWHDVHDAAKRVATKKENAHIVRLRAEGFTEEEVARVMDCDRRTLRRRFRATVAEIVAELGGNPFTMGQLERHVERRVTAIMSDTMLVA